VRSPLPSLLAVGGILAGLSWAAPARADLSSWLFAGGGATSWTQGGADRALNGVISLDLGVGTSPDASFIVGGLVRTTTILDNGTDLALLARAATWGFQAGTFGVALDAGGYGRFWGGDPSYGFTGALNLGAPLGLTLSLQASIGARNASAFGAVAGIDLLRLTVYRQSLLDWWPNPSAAQETQKSARARGRTYW